MIQCKKSLKEAFLHWINTFNTHKEEDIVHSINQLCDGVIIYRILMEIDSLFFQNAIHTISAENKPLDWILLTKWKVKKIYEYLTRYYKECLNLCLPNTNKYIPDLEAIAKDSSEEETMKFIKIVLACYFLSNKYKTYIKETQILNTHIQAILEETVSEIIEFKENDLKNEKDKKNILQTENEVAILNREKSILKKNYEILLEENIKLREDQQAMKSNLDNILKKLNEAEDIINDYKCQINNVQIQLDQSQQELYRYKENTKEKNTEIEQKDILISSLIHKNEELEKKTNEIILLKNKLQEEKKSVEKLKNIMEEYKKRKDSNIPDKNGILGHENVLYENINKTNLLINDEDIINNCNLKSNSSEAFHYEFVEKKESEPKVSQLEDYIDTIKIEKIKEKPSNEKLKLKQFQENLNKSLNNCSNDLDNQVENQLDILKSQISEEGPDVSKKESSNKSIVIIKNIIDNLKKNKNTEEKYLKEKSYISNFQTTNEDKNNFFENSIFNSSSKKHKDFGIPINKSKNSFDLEKKETMEFENSIYDLNSIHKENEHMILQIELEKLKKDIKSLENENQHQVILINKLLVEKNTLIQESIDNKNLLSELREKNNKLNTIITSISKNKEEKEKKQLETQKKLENLQNELDQKIAGALKAKQLLKKQDAMIKELKEKVLFENADELYSELELKNKQIEELKKINTEEIEKLKKENMHMTAAWYDLVSHIQQNDPTI
ncbi:hypothetical protein PORY_002216 [Pneumocystis oryctolagi]|uniref:Uncharacterized protein n=1 Tax=Pneumocystis oryctolagi TaxID=42067 RepID=A0ACB7CA91_9ASCO|nr:hypothetical protein PORY_002216 [Pneumocystis oryctolagi]